MFVPGKEFFKCTPCGVTLKGGLTEIKRHEQHKKHRKNATGYNVKSKDAFQISRMRESSTVQ